nr:MAG TPA: hypothetical protein [Bacteriophage sp.]
MYERSPAFIFIKKEVILWKQVFWESMIRLSSYSP